MQANEVLADTTVALTRAWLLFGARVIARTPRRLGHASARSAKLGIGQVALLIFPCVSIESSVRAWPAQHRAGPGPAISLFSALAGLQVGADYLAEKPARPTAEVVAGMILGVGYGAGRSGPAAQSQWGSQRQKLRNTPSLVGSAADCFLLAPGRNTSSNSLTGPLNGSNATTPTFLTRGMEGPSTLPSNA